MTGQSLGHYSGFAVLKELGVQYIIASYLSKRLP